MPEPLNEQSAAPIGQTGETFCYAHTNTPTRLRCSRCDRPICGRCAIPASVGQHCPECVAEARRQAPKVRTVMAATAPAATAIIVITVAFYFAQQVSPDLMTRFWLFRPRIDAGEWWRLITPVLVHANLFHIVMNMLVLYVYGTGVEQAFGSARFVLIYVVTAILASAFSYAFGGGAPSVGASGAVFGVVGALAVYLYNRRTSAFLGHHLRGLTTFLVLNLIISVVYPRIDLFAHLGGFVAGVVLGLAFDRSSGTRAEAPVSLQIAATSLVLLAGIALVATG